MTNILYYNLPIIQSPIHVVKINQKSRPFNLHRRQNGPSFIQYTPHHGKNNNKKK